MKPSRTVWFQFLESLCLSSLSVYADGEPLAGLLLDDLKGSDTSVYVGSFVRGSSTPNDWYLWNLEEGG